jgi:peptidoglycan/LPS O-acetylase OafA/YrhL
MIFLIFRAPLLENEVGGGTAAWLPLILALGWGGVLLSIVARPDLAPSFFRAPVLAFFARISFSLYLVHDVLVMPVWSGLSKLGVWGELGKGMQLLFYLGVYSVVSVIFALAVYYFVERPFLRIKDRVGIKSGLTSMKQTKPFERVLPVKN